MPAASYEELMDFETPFEKAAQAILESSGINAFISQSQTSLPGVYTGVAFDVGVARSERVPVTGTVYTQEYFRYSATLTLEVNVDRSGDTTADPSSVRTFLASARGKIRGAFRRTASPFTVTNLPLYFVNDIMPAGTTTGFDGARNQDVISLRFNIDFSIRPTSWPTA